MMDHKIKVNTLREVWKEADEEHWLPVQGISMQPILHQGDSICISHDLSAVKKGDILVYHKADGLVAHRVVRIIREGQSIAYQTKGDNSTRFDPPQVPQDILGKVVSIRKDGREINITTPGKQFWNSLLAEYHHILGNIYHFLRSIKYKFVEKSN